MLALLKKISRISVSIRKFKVFQLTLLILAFLLTLNVLSGGEIQRILIARAIYDDPSLLILDEATSHLDRETERKILQNILKDDKTIIMVSHKHNLQNEYKWDKVVDFNIYQ